MEPAENPASVSKPQEQGSLKQIRTFEGDIAETIHKQNESVVSMAQSEQARRDAVRVLGPQEVAQVTGKKTLVYSLLTILVLAIGAYGAWYTYKTYTQKIAPPIVATPANQLVGAESVVNIDASTLSRQALLASVDIEKGKSRPATAIEQVELRRGPLVDSDILSTADLLTRLNSHAPDALVRALSATSMLGLLGGAPSHTFLLINLLSFENAFPGMLLWEARLSEDLLPLFASEAVAANVPSVTAFNDITLQNRDARVLKDPTGHTVLLYAFFDNKILIITDTEETFRTIVNRLQSEKLSR